MSTDDDDRARDAADSCFIGERLRALDKATKYDAKATEDAYRRIILDLLRSRTPGPHTLQQVAGELNGFGGRRNTRNNDGGTVRQRGSWR